MKPTLFHRLGFGLILFLVLLCCENSSLYADYHHEPIVHVITLNDDTINPITAEYISHAINNAKREQAQCLIIKLDTPGGLLNSTRTIVKDILSAPLPVIVYIAPAGSHAGSAGVFITYASHIAAMAPSTNIGAAHPVQLGGENPRPKNDSLDEVKETLQGIQKEIAKSNSKNIESSAKENKQTTGKQPAHIDQDPMSSKILNDTLAWIKTIANKRGRNVQWAVKSVTESASITETEAVQNKVVEFIAKDEQELLAKIDGITVKVGDSDVVLRTRDAKLKFIDMTGRQKFFNVLANPNIAYILFILGFYGLLYEVTHPGFGVPGVLGIVFLIMAFTSMQALAVNYAGLALVFLGICFFIAEALVAGFGVLAFGGIVCTALGSLLLFDSTVLGMNLNITLIIVVTLLTAFITIFLVSLVIKSHRRKALGGNDGMVGEQGEVLRKIMLGKEGKVSAHGEIWTAISNEELEKGEKIIITSIEGFTLTVKKLQSN